MKNIKGLCVGLLALVLALGSGFCGAKEVFGEAEGVPDYRLAISPSREDLGIIKPGEQYTGEFKVLNKGKFSFEYEVSFAPYAVTNEFYDPSFTQETVYTEIKNWIVVDKENGTLEPGEEDTISYVVSVPDGEHGGAQVAAIIITMKNNIESNGGIEAVRQLGYIVYGNVDGQVTKTGRVLENKVPGFLFNPPIVASSLVENTGNVYTRATYKLQVFPLFSDEEVYTNEEQPENNIVFPETKRYNEIKWESAPQLGIFKVRSTVKIFDEESVTEKIVFLCPIWFLFVVLLLIFCIIFWIASRAMRRKKEA